MSAAAKNFVTRSASNDPGKEDKTGFYPTPRIATEQLLQVEKFKGRIWEPACGDGAISKVLEENKYKVLSTDLYNHGYGTIGLDFLTSDRTCPNIVTNPPFKQAEEFIHHAIRLTTGKVVMLGRLSWMEGSRRYKTIYNGATPLARIWVFSSRLHFHRSGDASQAGSSGMVAFAWYVWDHNHQGPVQLGWLPPFSKDR